MMKSVLSAFAHVPFARSGERTAGDREPATAILSAVHAFVNASRASSAAVVESLARALRETDSAIDVVLVFAPEGNDLACTYANGVRAQYYEGARLRRDDSHVLAARAAAAGHRVRGGVDGALLPTDRCALAVPICIDGDVRAVVYVSSPYPNALHHDDAIVRVVEHASAPFAMALEREADRADATYDGLTGLLTPRAFRAKLHDEMNRARFGRAPALTLWFIDTDRFKTVNDTYGHAAGDVVLQRMADLLRSHLVSGVESAARNGGDEFCALLDGVQKTVAIERAQLFCDAVRAHDFGVPLRVTASVGVATFPHDAQTSSELLEAADAAMYHSKRNGRDRVAFGVDRAQFAIYR